MKALQQSKVAFIQEQEPSLNTTEPHGTARAGKTTRVQGAHSPLGTVIDHLAHDRLAQSGPGGFFRGASLLARALEFLHPRLTVTN